MKWRKRTISRAEVGRRYRIRRGRAWEFLGTLQEKERGLRSGRQTWLVTFADGGEVSYRGFAGGNTVVHELVEP